MPSDSIMTRLRTKIAAMEIGPPAAPCSITTTELSQFVASGSFEHGFSEVLDTASKGSAVGLEADRRVPAVHIAGHTVWISRYVGLCVAASWYADQKTIVGNDSFGFDIDLDDNAIPLALVNTQGGDVDLIDAEAELHADVGAVLDPLRASTWLELNFLPQAAWELEALKACDSKLQRAS